MYQSTRSTLSLLSLLLVGCADQSTEQRERTVCTAYCECYSSTGGVDACVEDCIPEVPTITDECLACVNANANSCTSLDSECTDICTGETP